VGRPRNFVAGPTGLGRQKAGPKVAGVGPKEAAIGSKKTVGPRNSTDSIVGPTGIATGTTGLGASTTDSLVDSTGPVGTTGFVGSRGKRTGLVPRGVEVVVGRPKAIGLPV
jgi:hypothetical protein